MILFQTSIEIIYTAVLLGLAGALLTCYFALFYLAMMARDGCQICKWLRAKKSQLLKDIHYRAQSAP